MVERNHCRHGVAGAGEIGDRSRHVRDVEPFPFDDVVGVELGTMDDHQRREDVLRALDGSDFMRWGMPEVLTPMRLKRLADQHGVPRAPRRRK